MSNSGFCLTTFDRRRRSPLHAAAFADRVECISLLLGHGAHANIADKRTRRTPLMMAALNGQTNAVGPYRHDIHLL